MDIERLRELAGSPVKEDGYNEPGGGFDGDPGFDDSGRGNFEELADEVMFVTSQLFDMANEFKTHGKPNTASRITKLAKRLQAATGDQ